MIIKLLLWIEFWNEIGKLLLIDLFNEVFKHDVLSNGQYIFAMPLILAR